MSEISSNENNVILNPAWDDIKPRPWRRYFARIFDLTVSGMLGCVVLGFILGFVLFFYDESLVDPILDRIISFTDSKGRLGKILDTIFVSFVAIFVNSIFFAIGGTTLGKWIFGVKIINDANKSMGLKCALKREFLVFIKGLGCCIPIVSLITLIMGYYTLKTKKITSWDEKLNLKVIYRSSELQWFYSVLGIILYFVILAFIVWL